MDMEKQMKLKSIAFIVMYPNKSILSKMRVSIDNIKHFTEKYALNFERKDTVYKLFSHKSVEEFQELFGKSNVFGNRLCVPFETLNECLNSELLADMNPDFVMLYDEATATPYYYCYHVDKMVRFK